MINKYIEREREILYISLLYANHCIIMFVLYSTPIYLIILILLLYDSERDDQIADMRKRESVLQQKIAQLGSMHDQDATVRMQLGRRLEQVLIEKEEALDLLEMTKVSILVDIFSTCIFLHCFYYLVVFFYIDEYIISYTRFYYTYFI